MKHIPLQAKMHGDAWKAFRQEMIGRQYGHEEELQAWQFFLSGWLAKAKQADLLRNRR